MGRSPVTEAKCTGAQLASPHTAGVARLNLQFFHRVSLDLTEAFLWKVLQELGSSPSSFTLSPSPPPALGTERSHMEVVEGAFFVIPSGPLLYLKFCSPLLG